MRYNNRMSATSHNPYQWLETKNPKSRAWLAEEKKRFTRYIEEHGDIHKQVTAGLQAANNLPRTYLPAFDTKYLYFWEFTPGNEQSSLQRALKDGSDKECIFDQHEFESSDTASIVSWSTSPEGRYLAFSIAYNGGEDSILYVKDLENNVLLLDTLPNATRQFDWGSDGKTLFYVQSSGDRFQYPTVWAHGIGTHPSTDRLVFDKKLDENQFIALSSSDDNRQLEIYVSRDFDYDDIYLMDTATLKVSEVTTGQKATTSIFVKDGHIYARTNLEAPKNRLLRTALAHSYPPLSEWETLVAESADILEGVNYTKDYIVLHYLHDAASKTIFATYEGLPYYELPLQPYSYLSEMFSHTTSNELYYEWQSFTEPPTVTKFNVATKQSEQFFKELAPSLSDTYVTRQYWYESKDGTKVPMFLTYPKDANGPRPTLLTAYGGFSTNMTPYYIGYSKPLIDAGFSFALANIRGGGELGEQWHTAAVRGNKQRSFDDFIAAAEFLQKQGRTTAKQLVIQGGSNGGLLVAACMTQRPELFGAVVCEVPLIDMLRYHLFSGASSWIPEYGDPDDEKEREAIAAWSPLEHIRSDVAYPALYASTGDNDTRVHSHHAYKFVAKLRDVYGSEKSTILLRHDTAGGHGGGSGLTSWVKDSADIQTFILAEIPHKNNP